MSYPDKRLLNNIHFCPFYLSGCDSMLWLQVNFTTSTLPCSKESWAPKNWCFWNVLLEKTPESPLDCKRSSQSILKEISPEYSFEGLMQKLKLQYFGHSAYLTYMQNTSCEMPSWMKYKLESRLQGEISITSDMQMTPPLWQKAKRNWRASW